MQNERFFKKVVANVSIVFMLILVGFIAFSGQVNVVITSSSLKAYYSGDITKNNVSLMINVYWGTEFLPSMLNTLQEKQVKATFFVGGIWAEDNQELVDRIINEGHEIANHGYLHKDSSKLTEERLNEEIYLNHKLIKEMCEIEMTLFAPPSGDYNQKTIDIANRLGYKTILWTKDTIDWRDQDENLIFNRATNKISNGDLILMHPTEMTDKALPRIIDSIKQNNFNLVDVTTNLGDLKNVKTN